MILSGMTDMYKKRWLKNLQYILNFVGMPLKRYKRRCITSNFPNPMGVIRWIENDELIGFDIIHVAATSSIFGIPMHLVLNLDLEKEEIDLKKYKLSYGMYNEKIMRVARDSKMILSNPYTSIKHAAKHLEDSEARAKKIREFYNPLSV